MALETIVFQQDPFITTYGCEDFYTTNDSGSVHGNKSSILSTHFERSYHHQQHNKNIIIDEYNINNMSHLPCSMVQPYFKDASPVDQDQEIYSSTPADNGLIFTGDTSGKRNKRRRVKKASKNKEEVENQRMTHIAVERNRRRQMNHYLALLRSMMPPSYTQRGDQGSIVGGAINYVKELEQHLQYLETQKLKIKRSDDGHDQSDSIYVCNFFTFPQYKTSSSQTESSPAEADIEVTMVESHANLKVLSTRQPKQLFKMISGLQSLGLTVLHLNITTVDHRVFYSFNLKVEDDCQLTTVKEIATAVHEMMVMIKQEAIISL